MPPVAKPQFLATLLRHLGDLSGRSPRGVMESMKPGVWDDVRRVTDTMSQEKIDLMTSKFMNREQYLESNRRSPTSPWVAFAETNSRFPPERGMIAIPQQSLERYGPANIPHEGRHIQQQNKLLSGEDTIQGERFPLTIKRSANPNNNMVAFGEREIIPINDVRGIHSEFDLSEVDAALSEMATLEAAGDPNFYKYLYGYGQKQRVGGREFTEGQEPFVDVYRQVWNKIPEFVKDHYRKTIGVAAPTVGAFQPETQE